MAVSEAGVCRVTVVAGDRRLDVGLPGDVPLAELLPALATRIGLPDEGRAGWTLRRLTGPPLNSGLPVEDLEIRQGEVLHLRPVKDAAPVLLVDDVIDAVATSSQALPGRWSPKVARTSALGAAALALAGSVTAAGSAAAGSSGRLALAAAATILLLAAAAFADRGLGQPALATVLALAAAGFTVVAGVSVAGMFGLAGLAMLSVAAAAVLPVCAIGAVLAPEAGPGFTAATAAAVLALAGTGAATLLSAAPSGAAAIVLALAVLAGPVFPMLAIRISPVPMPFLPRDRADLADGGGDITSVAIDDGTRRADQLVTFLIGGTCTAGVAAAALLAGNSAWAGRTLLVCAAIALLLRARHHRGTAQRLWLSASAVALAGLVMAISVIHSGPTGRLAIALGLVGLGLGVAATASADRGDRSPTAGRLIDLAEVLAVIAVLPLALQLLGVYAQVRQLGG